MEEDVFFPASKEVKDEIADRLLKGFTTEYTPTAVTKKIMKLFEGTEKIVGTKHISLRIKMRAERGSERMHAQMAMAVKVTDGRIVGIFTARQHGKASYSAGYSSIWSLPSKSIQRALLTNDELLKQAVESLKYAVKKIQEVYRSGAGTVTIDHISISASKTFSSELFNRADGALGYAARLSDTVKLYSIGKSSKDFEKAVANLTGFDEMAAMSASSGYEFTAHLASLEGAALKEPEGVESVQTVEALSQDCIEANGIAYGAF